MNVSVKKSMKVMRNFISGALLVGAASFVYTGTASAHEYYGESGSWGYGMYNHHHIWDVHKSIKCFTAPEARCFLVVDFMHDYPYPFFRMMDYKFYYKGHYYPFSHRYYDYVDVGPYFHTVYYYSYDGDHPWGAGYAQGYYGERE